VCVCVCACACVSESESVSVSVLVHAKPTQTQARSNSVQNACRVVVRSGGGWTRRVRGHVRRGEAGSRHELEQVNQPCTQPLVLELGLLVIILHSTSNEAVAGVSNDEQLPARWTRGRCHSDDRVVRNVTLQPAWSAESILRRQVIPFRK
jgi:hypothetical protein